MANTVYGPYAPHTWVNGDSANATRLNNLETQAADALNGFNGDLFATGFVLSGVTCTKDGTVANQLDITSGRAYAVHSDGSLGLIVVAADNTHTTSTPSATYYLDLNVDGSWSWATSHSAMANYLTICSVTTDGSGNISAVTMNRPLNPVLLPNLAGTLSLPATAFPSGIASIASIGGQATAGSYPASPIVAQALDVHVTSTTLHTILSYTAPATGMYRLSGHAQIGNSGVVSISFGASYTEPHTSNTDTPYFTSPSHIDGSGGPSMINGLSQTPGSTLATDAMVIRAKASTAITVTYQAGSGTVNDFVSVVIERLA